MRAIVLDALGPPETLRVAELPIPEPGPGEVRVRVAAAGINPADWKILAIGSPGWSFPVAAGLDGSGTVDAVGPDVSHPAAGERVYWHGKLAQLGAFAEYAIVDAQIVVPIPSGLDFVTAAALPTAAFTAWQIIEEGRRLSPDEVGVVNAAAGGVGLFAMQLLARRAARVIAICSGANADYVRAYGADTVIDYRAEDTIGAIRRHTHGRGADLIVDPLGPDSAGRMLGVLAYGGELACVTGIPRPAALETFPRGRALRDIALGWAYTSGDPRAVEGVRGIAARVAELTASGALRVPIERRVPLEGVADALNESRSGHQRGKAVVLVDVQQGGAP